MDNFPEWLKWLGGAFAGITSILLGSKLIEKAFGRSWQRKDEREAIFITNDGKRIDADQNAFTAVMARLEKVEARVDELQTKLSQEMATSAGLKVENEALKKENERQAKKLHDFAEKLTHKDAEILSLTTNMHKMALEIERLKTLLGVTRSTSPTDET
jgi:predicted RNase H-like nuclease (RuvC/YqgF family)